MRVSEGRTDILFLHIRWMVIFQKAIKEEVRSLWN